MGQAKRMMEEREDNRNLAISYLVDADELEECETHSDVFGGGDAKNNLDAAFWKKANYDHGQGTNGAVPWASKMKLREFTDLLSDVYNEHFSDECPSCSHDRDDD